MNQYNFRYVMAITLVSAMGGLLFGYDWVVIGGAKPFYELFFHLDTAAQIGWAMSCALVGCLTGALFAGTLSEYFGRKKLLLAAAFIFVFTSIGTGLANTFPGFVVYRILGGVAIGMASSLSPMYIAEISPSEKRGMFVSINQLTIVVGILLAQMVNWLIAEKVPDGATQIEILNSWNGQTGWRWMFAATAFPAFLFFILAFFIPESPRWLIKKGNELKAKQILAKIGGEYYAGQTARQILDSVKNETGRVRLKDLTENKVLKILALGIFIAIFQQWCGINTILYYAEEVFSAAGFGVSDILFNIVITGSVNLIFTFVAIRLVDKVGRKVLMLTGAGGLAITYLVLGGGYYAGWTGWGMVFLVLTAVAIYSFTLAPVTWVLIAEIFPNRIRGVAMSVAVFFLWSASFALTYTFPVFNQNLGTAKTYWLYALICVAGFMVLKWKLPETKGKSLEEIEKEIINHS
jgi:MFS transporter, SP family, arabinose:H+ symporter